MERRRSLHPSDKDLSLGPPELVLASNLSYRFGIHHLWFRYSVSSSPDILINAKGWIVSESVSGPEIGLLLQVRLAAIEPR